MLQRGSPLRFWLPPGHDRRQAVTLAGASMSGGQRRGAMLLLPTSSVRLPPHARVWGTAKAAVPALDVTVEDGHGDQAAVGAPRQVEGSRAVTTALTRASRGATVAESRTSPANALEGGYVGDMMAKAP